MEEYAGEAAKEEGVDIKLVIESLLKNRLAWQKFNAGNKGLTGQYREKNNKFMEKYIKFAKKVIEEVSEKNVVCINPISVAANREGKNRFIIYLSR